MNESYHMKTQNIIGNEEWCAFGELNIPAIKARIDSGAKTSSIQATNIKRVVRNGESWVDFEVNPVQDNRSVSVFFVPLKLSIHASLKALLGRRRNAL